MAITDDKGNLFEARPGTPHELFRSAGKVRLSALGEKVLRLGSAMSADPAFSYVWKVVQAVGHAAEDYGALKESIKLRPKSINVRCLVETVEIAHTLSNQLAAHHLISGLRLNSKGDNRLSRSSADGTAAKAYRPGTGGFRQLYLRMLQGPAVVKPGHKESMWC